MTIEVTSTGARDRVLVAASGQIVEGGRLVVDVGPTTIGLFRIDGVLRAYENVCAHQGGPVCQGKILPGVAETLEADSDRNDLYFDDDDLHLVCPWHGYEYSLRTGRHAGHDAVGLRSFSVDETDGHVYVTF